MWRLVKIAGYLLIAGALAIVGLIYVPVLNQELTYLFKTQKRLAEEADLGVEPVSRDFGLIIPKIGVNTKVFADVDPTNPRKYLPLLKEGAAHAKGSDFPGGKGNVFIFAHSADSPLNITRYNAVFYLLNKLKPGDEILVYYLKEKYHYQVVEKIIVPPEVISDYIYHYLGESLVLQTCHPPGTTLNRLLVIAKETV